MTDWPRVARPPSWHYTDGIKKTDNKEEDEENGETAGDRARPSPSGMGTFSGSVGDG
ncbi:hypothetical protein ACH5RR_008546, partial [Cinchona calisaya]